MKNSNFVARMRSLAHSNGYSIHKKDMLSMVSSLLDEESMDPSLPESTLPAQKATPKCEAKLNIPAGLVYTEHKDFPNSMVGTLSLEHVFNRLRSKELLGEVYADGDGFRFQASGITVSGEVTTLQEAIDNIAKLHSPDFKLPTY